MTREEKLVAEFEDMQTGLLMLSGMIGSDHLVEDERAIARSLFEELLEILERVIPTQTRSLLNMPELYVQFAKQYRVGDETVRVLGLAAEYGYSNEEALEKIRFSMTNDIAVRKLEPTSNLIYWESSLPEGGEYIEGSFSCTEVIYQSLPEQYVHSHDPSFRVRVVSG